MNAADSPRLKLAAPKSHSVCPLIRRTECNFHFLMHAAIIVNICSRKNAQKCVLVIIINYNTRTVQHNIIDVFFYLLVYQLVFRYMI